MLYRRFGHPASLKPGTDIRPGPWRSAPNWTPAAYPGTPVRHPCDRSHCLDRPAKWGARSPGT
ncbi:hypothetical protein SNL152K_4520 [Streptomyces sp. NL15-2K]|nr:hypothetical protein SNL152K_4520 [Streptomyces sp. NL15-2K]